MSFQYKAPSLYHPRCDVVGNAYKRCREAVRRACGDNEREQAERVRAAVEAKNAALEAARRAKMEALKIRNWMLGQAMVRNALSQSGLSEREQE